MNGEVIKCLWVPWRVGRRHQAVARGVIRGCEEHGDIPCVRWVRQNEAPCHHASAEEDRPVGDGGRAKSLLFAVQKAGASGHLSGICWNPAPDPHDGRIASVEVSYGCVEAYSTGDCPVEADARTMKPTPLWVSAVK